MEKNLFKKASDPAIVYMGTPEISAIVLRGLVENGYRIVGVVCNEDKPFGRKGKVEEPATKKVALEHGIPVFQPHRIRTEYDFLASLHPDIIVTMAYGQIVPQAVLDAPKYGCVNLHGSILPKWRGAAPIQRSIMAGEKVTGVTLMEMVSEMDAGKMFDHIEVPILPEDNYSSLSQKIGLAARELILRDLLPLLNGNLLGVEQDPNEVTFATKIKPEDEHLNLQLGCADFVNSVRGMSETPGGYLFFEGKKLKLFKTTFFSSSVETKIGERIPDKKRLLLQLSDGVVSLDSVQLEGKKRMGGADFMRGMHVEGKEVFFE